MRSDMFMRMTGWLLVVLGVILGVFCLIGIYSPATSETADVPVTQPSSANTGVPLAAILGPFSLLALGAGVFILLYGGRGGLRTRNPAVRN